MSAKTKPKAPTRPETETIPGVELSAIPSLKKHAKKITTLVLQRTGLSAKIKALEAQKKELDGQILPLIYRSGEKKVLVEGYPVRVVESGQTRLVESKLIEEGVDPETIARCKVYTPKAPYLQIDKRKEDEGSEDEDDG